MNEITKFYVKEVIRFLLTKIDGKNLENKQNKQKHRESIKMAYQKLNSIKTGFDIKRKLGSLVKLELYKNFTMKRQIISQFEIMPNLRSFLGFLSKKYTSGGGENKWISDLCSTLKYIILTNDIIVRKQKINDCLRLLNENKKRFRNSLLINTKKNLKMLWSDEECLIKKMKGKSDTSE